MEPRWPRLASVPPASQRRAAEGEAAGPRAAKERLGHPGWTDGKDLLPRAKISEVQAIAAAQSAAAGDANEVDLEHLGDRLIYSVDVGAKDVKVDAVTATVVRVEPDD